jgi:S1-C subfamily serine protease
MMILFTLPARSEAAQGGASSESSSLTFSRLVVRDDRHKDLYFAAEEYRVYILDALRKSGFVVVGAENLLFDQDKGGEARFVLGGTVTSVLRGFDPERPSLAEMAVVWELFDIQQQVVIYKVETRDTGTLRSKKNSVALLMRCLGSLMRRQAFRNALLPIEGELPSATNDAPATFQSCPTSLALPKDMSRAQEATVVVRLGAMAGSGVLISRDGVVITANHVVEALSTATVELKDGRSFPARVMRRDVKRDISVLRIDAQETPCLPVAMNLPREGETLYAIGTPISKALSFTVTKGVVSSIRDHEDARWIQTDAALNPGNSGGPLLNETGTVIGLVSWGLGKLGVEGISFAISSASALAVLSLSQGEHTTLPVLAPRGPLPSVTTYVDNPDPHYKDTPKAKALALKSKRQHQKYALIATSTVLLVSGGVVVLIGGLSSEGDARTSSWIGGGIISGLGGAGLIITPIAFRDRSTTKISGTTSTAYGLSLALDF